MRKIKLETDALRVETFDVTPEIARWGGTVAGAERFAPATDDTRKPDCDVSGSPTCGYSNCGDNTCGTCDDASWCGNSCVLVCDGGIDVPAIGEPRIR
jgi:hypothetical protein